jgi:hypothetical protein
MFEIIWLAIGIATVFCAVVSVLAVIDEMRWAMATDEENAEFFTGVLANMEEVAKEYNVPMERLVVTYSNAKQPNGLPEYYKIEVKPCDT